MLVRFADKFQGRDGSSFLKEIGFLQDFLDFFLKILFPEINSRRIIVAGEERCAGGVFLRESGFLLNFFWISSWKFHKNDSCGGGEVCRGCGGLFFISPRFFLFLLDCFLDFFLKIPRE